MSTNLSWKGRRYKTTAYERWRRLMLAHLRKTDLVIPKGKVMIMLVFGTSAANDLDNLIKPCLDSLQDYCKHFNDRNVMRIQADKVIAKKGAEFVKIRAVSWIP